MRIKFLCRRYIPGEAWTNRLLAYAKGFAEHGHDVSLVFLISDKKRTKYSIPIPGVRVVNLWEKDGWLARQHRAISYLKNKRFIKKIIEDNDIIFMMDAGGYFLKEVLKSRKKVTKIYEATEHPALQSDGTVDENKTPIILEKFRGLDHIFVISQSLKKCFIKHGFEENKVTIINMFVDINRFKNLSKSHNKEKSIVYCGIISYSKDGADVLIKAFAIFHAYHRDYRLIMIGRGFQEDTIDKLKELARKYNILDYVDFIGQIPVNEIPQTLVDATILALARPDNLQNRNGFPTKLGEYLSTGNPVVVTSVGEIPLFIKDGVNGYVAKPNDEKSFASKLCEVAANLEKAKEVGQKGMSLAHKEFSYYEQSEIVLSHVLGK